MATTRRTRGRDEIARILVTAAQVGTEAAAAQHHLSRRTVQRYADLAAKDPELSRAVAVKRAALVEASDGDWIATTEAARKTLLARVLSLAGSSVELRDVAGALKIVTDANIAERVILDGLHQPSAGTPESARQAPTLGGLAARLGADLH